MSKYQRMQSAAATIADDGINEGKDEVSHWVVNINKILEQGVVYDSGKKWTIYRVPTNLREIHSKAFVPKLISIGPFHYGDQRLRVMDEHKERYLLRLLYRLSSKVNSMKQRERADVARGSCSTGNGGLEIEEVAPVEQGNADGGEVKKKITLEVLETEMKKLMPATRETYSEVVTMNNDQFVEMMVLDGCFIVELLRLHHNKSPWADFYSRVILRRQNMAEDDDPIFNTRWMLQTLRRDMLMLENQLPFFVLEKLYKLTQLDEYERPLIDLVEVFFRPIIPPLLDICRVAKLGVPKHILGMLFLCFITPIQEKARQNFFVGLEFEQAQAQLIHCVTELQEVGVRFKRGEHMHLLDINFYNGTGTLEVPPLDINDNTVPVFLNFLAYEQCDQKAEPLLANYFMFLDGLISSANDVEILHQHKIINHALGSNENIVNLFNKVCRELVFDNSSYLSKQMVEMNKYWSDYYAKKWNVWRSNLIRDYFSSPWTALSLGAAIVLLILTALQTVYSAISYYHQ